MGNTTKHEKFWFDKIMEKGSKYVIDNWGKFSHSSKERIFLACMNKAIANKNENKHSGEIEGLADKITIIYGNKKDENDKEVPGVQNRVQDVSKQG